MRLKKNVLLQLTDSKTLLPTMVYDYYYRQPCVHKTRRQVATSEQKQSVQFVVSSPWGTSNTEIRSITNNIYRLKKVYNSITPYCNQSDLLPCFERFRNRLVWCTAWRTVHSATQRISLRSYLDQVLTVCVGAVFLVGAAIANVYRIHWSLTKNLADFYRDPKQLVSCLTILAVRSCFIRSLQMQAMFNREIASKNDHRTCEENRVLVELKPKDILYENF